MTGIPSQSEIVSQEDAQKLATEASKDSSGIPGDSRADLSSESYRIKEIAIEEFSEKIQVRLTSKPSPLRSSSFSKGFSRSVNVEAAVKPFIEEAFSQSLEGSPEDLIKA